MKKALKQLLSEIKSIDQETIENNKNDFLSRDGMIKRIQERIEDIIKEDEKNDGKKHMYEYWINGGNENETI